MAHVELRAVEKRFGPVRVLADIDVVVVRGSIHALVGENGAGKSTLGKIITGLHRPDGGELRVDGALADYGSPRDALRDGLTIVAQELSLMPARTVAENVFLGSEKGRLGLVHDADTTRRYETLEAQIGFGLPADAMVGSLRLADQQKVEILRAVARDAKLIVMDEPTAALEKDEARRLREIVRQLSASGTTIVFISHDLEEVLSLADEVTILRDGRVVRANRATDETPDTLITSMIGRNLESAFPTKRRVSAAASPVLDVRALSTSFLDDVNLTVRPGEIVGLAGLVGSGRSEVAHAIFGADPTVRGSILVDGRAIETASTRAAMRAGIALVPESRKDQGLMLGRPILENITIASLPRFAKATYVRRGPERERGQRMLDSVGVRGAQPGAPVMTLSGGNQQKVLLAKWLMRSPRVLIADEPTRGVDVGAKHVIYELLHSLAGDGMGVLLITSELEEVLGLAHRVVVMHRGRVMAEIDGAEATEEHVLRLAFGGSGLMAEAS